MLKRLILLVFICTVAVLISSCVTPTYRLQDGNYKLCEGNSPPDKIATLLVNGEGTVGGLGLYVAEIDGFSRSYGGGWPNGSLRFELLPGEHTLLVGFVSDNTHSVDQVPITFYAKAGKVYVVMFGVYDTTWNDNRTGESMGKWKAWVEEVAKFKKGIIPQVTQLDQAAEIYFIRERSELDDSLGKFKYELIFDGIDFFRIGWGEYTMIKADPGKHWASRSTFSLGEGLWGSVLRKSECLEFNLQPNQKYYIDITSRPNLDYSVDASKFFIRQFSMSDGEAAVKKCAYVPYTFR